MQIGPVVAGLFVIATLAGCLDSSAGGADAADSPDHDSNQDSSLDGTDNGTSRQPVDTIPGPGDQPEQPDADAQKDVPRNVSFAPDFQVKTYIWVPEEELQALIPDGWAASCHEYAEGNCAFTPVFSEITIEYFEYDWAFIGDEYAPAGTVTAVLYNVEAPTEIDLRVGPYDNSWMLAGLWVTEPKLHAWLSHWNMTNVGLHDFSVQPTYALPPGSNPWYGHVSFQGPGLTLDVQQPNAGYILLESYDQNHGRMYEYDATMQAQPQHYLRHEQNHPDPMVFSRGRGIAQGSMAGFSGDEWKDDHAWFPQPTEITWEFMDVIWPDAAAS